MTRPGTEITEGTIGGEKKTHPAFGLIGLSRHTGHATLFGVDFPTGHTIALTIQRASHTRTLSSDFMFAEEQLIEIEMSEVQFAQMISSMNIGFGVPCTLRRVRDEESGGKLDMLPEIPEADAMTDTKQMLREVKGAAFRATASLDSADELMQQLLDGRLTLNKTNLKTLAGTLAMARGSLESSIPFVSEQAMEAINDRVAKGNAEYEAYASECVRRIGLAALGEHVQQALDAGIDPMLVGLRAVQALEDNHGTG